MLCIIREFIIARSSLVVRSFYSSSSEINFIHRSQQPTKKKLFNSAILYFLFSLHMHSRRSIFFNFFLLKLLFRNTRGGTQLVARCSMIVRDEELNKVVVLPCVILKIFVRSSSSLGRSFFCLRESCDLISAMWLDVLARRHRSLSISSSSERRFTSSSSSLVVVREE